MQLKHRATNRLPINGGKEQSLEDRKMLAISFVDTDEWEATNFDNGSTDPFESMGSGYVHSTGSYIAGFYEDNYNGNRWGLGSELRSDVEISEEGYAGWNMTIPSDSYPDDKTAIVHQWFNYPDDSDSFWGAVLVLKDNDLYLSHRHYKYDAEEILIAENIPFDEKLEFKSRIIPGDGDGRLVYVLNEEIVYNEGGLQIGSGFDENGDLTNGHIEQQIGQYAADVDNHEEGEERLLFFDNISVLRNDNMGLNSQTAWNRVDPDTSN